MPTLNGQFKHAKNSNKYITEADRILIDDFLIKNGARACPPCGADGNEMSTSTHDRIKEKRKEFREKMRNANK
jgi:hypothetical protein